MSKCNLTFSNNLVNVNPLTGITNNVNFVTPPHTTPNKGPHPSPLLYSQGQLGKRANRLAWEMARTGWVSFFIIINIRTPSTPPFILFLIQQLPTSID
jgi:hypothetical protein